MRKINVIVSAALLGIATLAVGVRVHAEGGLTLEERVQRLERQKEMPRRQRPRRRDPGASRRARGRDQEAALRFTIAACS